MINVILRRGREFGPGLTTAGVVALAAAYVAGSLGGPVMLLALLIGIAFNFLGENEVTRRGLEAARYAVLRIGVALLGARISFDQVQGLGLETVAIVLAGVVVTLVGGTALARRMGLERGSAFLSAGAVAICGASAALAIASILPKTEERERATTLVVVCVTALSTLAMITYPPLTKALGFNEAAAGIFLGATIHDVAQVVGAGYIISDYAGETATIIKLIRVTCLLPVVVILAIILGARNRLPEGEGRPPILPPFIWAFLVLVSLNSFHLLPTAIVTLSGEVARWCLLIAVAALGIRTNLGELVRVGPKPMLAMLVQTLLLGGFILAALVAVDFAP